MAKYYGNTLAAPPLAAVEVTSVKVAEKAVRPAEIDQYACAVMLSMSLPAASISVGKGVDLHVAVMGAVRTDETEAGLQVRAPQAPCLAHSLARGRLERSFLAGEHQNARYALAG
jgi:hypothetical protein